MNFTTYSYYCRNSFDELYYILRLVWNSFDELYYILKLVLELL